MVFSSPWMDQLFIIFFFFADDSLFIFKAYLSHFQVFQKILQKYEASTSQVINLAKSYPLSLHHCKANMDIKQLPSTSAQFDRNSTFTNIFYILRMRTNQNILVSIRRSGPWIICPIWKKYIL